MTYSLYLYPYTVLLMNRFPMLLVPISNVYPLALSRATSKAPPKQRAKAKAAPYQSKAFRCPLQILWQLLKGKQQEGLLWSRRLRRDEPWKVCSFFRLLNELYVGISMWWDVQSSNSRILGVAAAGIGLLEPGDQHLFLIKKKKHSFAIMYCYLGPGICFAKGLICLTPPGNAKGQAAGNTWHGSLDHRRRVRASRTQ